LILLSPALSMQANPISDEVPATGEGRVRVVEQKFFIHSFGLEITKATAKSWGWNDLLQSWLAKKGEIFLKKAVFKVVFARAGGLISICFTQKDAGPTDFAESMFIPNRLVFGSNTMNTNTELSQEFVVPAGFTDKIWPLTGALPLGSITIASKTSVEANVSIFLEVEASGPFVHTYSINWEDGVVTPQQGGFH